MWTRKELKEKAKVALRRNYWKTVLVAMILALITGGGYASSGSFAGGGTETEVTPAPAVVENAAETMDKTDMIIVVLAIAIFVLVFVVLTLAIGLAVNAVLINPLEVGIRKFMLKGVDDTAEVKEVAYGFDHSYKKIVKTMFFRDLYTVLWALLFIIPGIYKSYQYRLVPYIMTENPEMDYKEALQLSKDMMEGQKWNTFVLDLSFIGWHLLSLLTCGILAVFYVAPYKNLTDAALYKAIKGSREEEIVDGI